MNPPPNILEKGLRIFAKMKGYCAWPARIETVVSLAPNPSNSRYEVFFYGTHQTAICKGAEIFKFSETRDKLGLPKKNPGFNEAMWEIVHRPDITARAIQVVAPNVQEAVAVEVDRQEAAPPVVVEQEANPAAEETPKKKKRQKLFVEELPLGSLSEDEDIINEILVEKEQRKSLEASKAEAQEMETEEKTADNAEAERHINVSLSVKQVVDLLSIKDIPDCVRGKLAEHLLREFDRKKVA